MALIERLRAILARTAWFWMRSAESWRRSRRPTATAPDRDHSRDHEITIEDMIADEEMVITVTNSGYIKRSPLSLYRSQQRGGKGRREW